MAEPPRLPPPGRERQRRPQRTPAPRLASPGPSPQESARAALTAGAQAHREPRSGEQKRRRECALAAARWGERGGEATEAEELALRSRRLPRTPASVCVTVSMEISPAEDNASGPRRCSGLTRPPADGDSSSARPSRVAAAVEAAGAARLPLPFAHSARPAAAAVVVAAVVPAVAAVASIAAAKAAAAVASQNTVTRQRPASLRHHAATG